MKTFRWFRKHHYGRSRAQRGIGFAALVLVAAALSACGGGGADSTPTAASSPTATVPTPSPTPVPPPAVGEIVWASAIDESTNEATNIRETFRTSDETLFAVVRVTNIPAGAVISAEWRYNDVPLDGTAAGVVPPADYNGGFVQFHLSRSEQQPWPAGTYAIRIDLNGETVQESQIEVQER